MTPSNRKIERRVTMMDENAPESVRAPLASKVDEGAFTDALNATNPGERPNLDRMDTPEVDVEKPRKQDFNSQNPLQPTKIKHDKVQAHIFAD